MTYQALVISNGCNEKHLPEQKAICLSTYGILFMATPHQGGGGVLLGKLAVNIASIAQHTKKEYLQHLERDSEWLMQQQMLYSPISDNFKTVYFYESYPTRLPGGKSIIVCFFHDLSCCGSEILTSAPGCTRKFRLSTWDDECSQNRDLCGSHRNGEVC